MATTNPELEAQRRFSLWASEHGRAVRGFIWGLVRRDDVADDLTQETFRKAWQARDSYQDRGTPRAYLLRIADRLVCDYGRRGLAEVNLDSDGWACSEPVGSGDEPVEVLEQSEAQAALSAALDRISPAQRRVLLLRYYGGLAFAEIAASMNCPLNTVLSHGQRGLTALRKMLSETPP